MVIFIAGATPSDLGSMAAVLQHGEYRVRHWCSGDREAAAEIVRVCLKEYGLEFESEVADRDAVYVEECYKKGEFWVVESGGGKLVGTAGYYEVEEEEEGRATAVEIRKMYLLKEARGKKLGRALLQALEKRIREKGYARIFIETASVLSEACKLYTSAGYQPMGGVETQRCDQRLYKSIDSN